VRRDQLRLIGPDERADADTKATVLTALINDDELHAADIDVESVGESTLAGGLISRRRTLPVCLSETDRGTTPHGDTCRPRPSS
jgi:hypothetical protein